MSENIKLINVFVASPSDVQNERGMTDSAVRELNKMLGDVYNIRIELKKWETNTWPAIGEYSQDVINKQIGDYDIFVGIMKHKFGSPTENAESGTEEEFNRAYDNFKSGNCKNLMFFFSKEPLPQDADLDQFQKVRNFKKGIDAKGCLYAEYENDTTFEADFRQKLGECIKSLCPQSNDGNHTDNEIVGAALTDNFDEYLRSTDNFFTHPSGEELTLDDIFIPQNLRKISNESKNEKKINLENLTNAIDVEGIRYNILGADSSGKTALCKYIFKRYFNQNLYPVLLKGDDLNTNVNCTNIIKITTERIKEQYKSIPTNISDDKENNNSFLIIIDDFQKSAKGKETYWKLLVSNIERLFENIVIVGDNSLSTKELSANPPFENFERYVVMEFGADMRNSLVEKWMSFNTDISIESPNELFQKIDEANKNIKAILGKSIVPSYPIYILGILQALETGQQGGANFSLHGFYYEHLINDKLINAIDDVKNIGFYNNFMTSFCYELFLNKAKNVSIDDFDAFYKQYCEEHDITGAKNIGKELVKSTLAKSKLLLFNSGTVRLGHKFVYYFFVARYIANHINEESIQNVVRKLCERIFKDEYGYIILFVTHMTKNDLIIQTLIDNANDIFNEYTPTKLEEEIKEINNLIKEIPNKIIGEIDFKKERDAQLKLETELEEKQKEFDNDTANYSEFSLEDDISSIDLIAKMNLAVKSIDILGQIAIKYWGELNSAIKYTVVSAAYQVGLRTLCMYHSLMNDCKDEIIEHVKKIIIDKYIKEKYEEWDSTLNKELITKSAQDVIIGLSYFSSLAIIRRISSSVGDENLKLTYDRILDANPYNSFKLINLSIDMNYPQIPFEKLKQYSEDFKSNKMCHMLLRDLLINHMYKFDIDYKMKSKISELNLGIDIKQQRLIQGSSLEKR